jgi:hypothetical protein
MTDIGYFASIVISSVIRQFDLHAFGGMLSQYYGNAALVGLGEFDPYEPIAQIIKIVIVAFSLLLAGLSISAYRRTAIKGIVYAAVAFGLFAVQMLFDYLEDEVPGFETPYNDVVFLSMTLAILLLFFLAIVYRKSKVPS